MGGEARASRCAASSALRVGGGSSTALTMAAVSLEVVQPSTSRPCRSSLAMKRALEALAAVPSHCTASSPPLLLLLPPEPMTLLVRPPLNTCSLYIFSSTLPAVMSL